MTQKKAILPPQRIITSQSSAQIAAPSKLLSTKQTVGLIPFKLLKQKESPKMKIYLSK
jgi:hypothetical protein